jgi:DNA invertase Pin-like site-specific DNA recombinase
MKPLKAAVYIRRSKGAQGSTKEQLERISPRIQKLIDSKVIKPIDGRIVGRDINKKQKFNPTRDLAREGDIFNEGDGASALDSARERRVLNEMLRRMREGQYDIVLAESLDRYSRDPLDFATVALDLWRKEGKQFRSLTEDYGYGVGTSDQEEAIITTLLMWGGESAKTAIKKSIDALDKKLNRGFIGKPKAELVGSGSKGAGLDYRKAWGLMQAYGEKPNKIGTLGEKFIQNPTAICKVFNKDNKWATDKYEFMEQWNRYVYPDGQTALEKWFDAVDVLNRYIENHPFKRAGDSYKTRDVKDVLKAFTGFLAYPAGINPSKKFEEGKKFFILFPNPADFEGRLEEFISVDEPSMIEGWELEKIPVQDAGELMKHQTQYRTGK